MGLVVASARLGLAGASQAHRGNRPYLPMEIRPGPVDDQGEDGLVTASTIQRPALADCPLALPGCEGRYYVVKNRKSCRPCAYTKNRRSTDELNRKSRERRRLLRLELHP